MGERVPRRLLVTGGAGFIGANFVRHVLERGTIELVVVLDALTYAGHLSSLGGVDRHPAFRFVRGDVRDRELAVSLLREERIDTVVHFAAESHVDRSITDPEPFVDVNVAGTHSLLAAAREVWLGAASENDPPRRFHHVSTDEVYGSLGPDEPPFTEQTPYAPSSPYAATKAAADHLVRAYHRTYGLPVTISNCSNNYGPYQLPEKLIPLCIARLVRGGPLPLYGDGGQVRDWLHVEDHCRALDLILDGGRVGATYNVGAGCERTNLELIRQLCRTFDELAATRPELLREAAGGSAPAGPAESLITLVEDRPGHDRRYAIDGRRISGELGFRAVVGLGEGLRRTLEWYLEHPDWWRPLVTESPRG